jgi:hypothetical protein
VNIWPAEGDVITGRRKLHDEDCSKMLVSLNIIREEDDGELDGRDM